ncbi:MAG: CDGSH iron-sulfur domain-containing protein [Chitinophagaceae bacterium]
MSFPKIAACEPKSVLVKPGKTYSWCACGLSATQPFCDGKHKLEDCGMQSLKWQFEEEKEVWLCQCKHTSNPPFCDGTHLSLRNKS